MQREAIVCAFPAVPGWRLVVLDSESDGGIFLPVAAWAHVRRDSGSAGRVVGLVQRPLAEGPSLDFYDEEDGDVVGMAAPGEDEAFWLERVAAVRKEAADADEEAQRVEDVPRVVPCVSEADVEVLRAVAAAAGHGTSPTAQDGGGAAASIARLAEHGLLEAHRWSSNDTRRRWVETPLGRDLLAHLDKLRRRG